LHSVLLEYLVVGLQGATYVCGVHGGILHKTHADVKTHYRPNAGEHLVRYYCWYSNVSRGKRRKAEGMSSGRWGRRRSMGAGSAPATTLERSGPPQSRATFPLDAGVRGDEYSTQTTATTEVWARRGAGGPGGAARPSARSFRTSYHSN
jgi:hypothetical protein